VVVFARDVQMTRPERSAWRIEGMVAADAVRRNYAVQVVRLPAEHLRQGVAMPVATKK
jgi:hypothetical protein